MSAEFPSASGTDQPQAESQPAVAERTVWKSGPVIGLLFGLLGGLLAWAVVHAAYPFFVVPDEALAGRMTVPDELQRPVDRNNAMAALAVLGAASAVALSAGEGLCRRSLQAALIGGAVCGLIVAAIGCAAGYLGFIGMEYYQSRPDLTELAKTLRVQSAMLGAIGGGVGLVLAVLLARRLLAAILCLVAGILAGAIAGMAYPMICAVLMPNVITEVVIPLRAPERLLWTLLFAGLVGLAVPANARQRTKKQPTT